MVTLSWEAMKVHYPQEYSKVNNNTDVQSVLNSLNTQDVVQKAQEENHINDADTKRCQGSYKDDDRNQVTNIPKAKPVLQNASINIDYDTDAIFEEYKIESPISKFDEDSVLSEDFDFMENDLSYVRDYLTELNDVETDVLEAPYIQSYEEDNTQFRSNASGALIAFAAYKHGPSNACLKTADNSTANRKQTCTFHMKGCNLPAKDTNDDENAVATDYSMQEACDPSVGLWPWADQFSEGCIPNDNDIQHLNWEWSEIFKIL
ncbi:hypothetical protein B7P43_G16943 [Cryptotermes secundus]|uniref:Uncharacterized protein n=3 Tax=Cryptotermes secundus TaxID=105785 RepID=A0A2J7QUM4_9NEOP|nr:hypothetical protein B7P43_G16943 [Cryptotermes secundus]